ncbi:unnamed protein product [Paramecium octaurelia]|uniref:Uncharacterized protein n=1 Tax=Paramecium octaurelia TaxID=43137 RepID=A0A8S1THS5_PAROT|nr:unnamed protein product [Paramecium octaurelia]
MKKRLEYGLQFGRAKLQSQLMNGIDGKQLGCVLKYSIIIGAKLKENIQIEAQIMYLENTIMIKGRVFGSSLIKIKCLMGGLYKQGLKNGKWIDLNDNFWNLIQIIYYGEYKNGKKIGL